MMNGQHFSWTACRCAAAALLLGGCAAGADHYGSLVAPLRVPAHYSRDGAAPGPSQQTLHVPAAYAPRDAGADAWWKGFGDARLDRLVDRVLRVNADLASAGFALRKARLDARLAGVDLLPQPSAALSSSASRTLASGGTTGHSHSASLGLSWEIDLWGRLRAQREVKEWEASATAQDLQNTALSLVGETCRAYWEIAYLNEAISTGEQSIDRLTRILRLVTAQHDAGEVSLIEVREAQQNLQSERQDQASLLQQRTQARHTLAVLLDGQAWPADEEAQDTRGGAALEVSEGLPAQLLGRRPDLRAAEMRLRGASANIDATVRSYYPALTLTGDLSGSSTSLRNVLREPAATLGSSLSFPFLNVAQMRINSEAAGTEFLQAASSFRTTLHTALKEVDDALAARERYAQRLEAQRRSLDAARDLARMYEVRYRSGEAALRVWLDAQQTRRTAELGLASLQRDALDNDVTLMLALGGSASESRAGPR